MAEQPGRLGGKGAPTWLLQLLLLLGSGSLLPLRHPPLQVLLLLLLWRHVPHLLLLLRRRPLLGLRLQTAWPVAIHPRHCSLVRLLVLHPWSHHPARLPSHVVHPRMLLLLLLRLLPPWGDHPARVRRHPWLHRQRLPPHAGHEVVLLKHVVVLLALPRAESGELNSA